MFKILFLQYVCKNTVIIICVLNLCKNLLIIYQDLEELNCKRSKWELERAGQVTKFFSDESFCICICLCILICICVCICIFETLSLLKRSVKLLTLMEMEIMMKIWNKGYWHKDAGSAWYCLEKVQLQNEFSAIS